MIISDFVLLGHVRGNTLMLVSVIESLSEKDWEAPEKNLNGNIKLSMKLFSIAYCFIFSVNQTCLKACLIY